MSWPLYHQPLQAGPAATESPGDRALQDQANGFGAIKLGKDLARVIRMGMLSRVAANRHLMPQGNLVSSGSSKFATAMSGRPQSLVGSRPALIGSLSRPAPRRFAQLTSVCAPTSPGGTAHAWIIDPYGTTLAAA